MNVILLGAPGVGKGTCASTLSRNRGIPHVSTGNMLREAVTEKTELGKRAKRFMNSGRLVPDELVTEMTKERLAQPDCRNGFLLDGYPRTVAQAEALQSFASVNVVLNLSAPQKVIMDRLTGRMTCKQCNSVYHVRNMPPKKENVCDKCNGMLYQRSDEQPEVVEERLRVYENQTKPLIDFYRKLSLLVDVDASSEVDEVVKQCEAALSD